MNWLTNAPSRRPKIPATSLRARAETPGRNPGGSSVLNSVISVFYKGRSRPQSIRHFCPARTTTTTMAPLGAVARASIDQFQQPRNLVRLGHCRSPAGPPLKIPWTKTSDIDARSGQGRALAQGSVLNGCHQKDRLRPNLRGAAVSHPPCQEVSRFHGACYSSSGNGLLGDPIVGAGTVSLRSKKKNRRFIVFAALPAARACRRHLITSMAACRGRRSAVR